MTALAGLKVLDLAEGIAGPMVGMWFADFGADVVKVEPTGGDWGRQFPGAIVWNRGKRSITADPDVAEQRALVVEMACGADVVLGTTETLAAFGLLDPSFQEAHRHLVIGCLDAYEGAAPWCGGREDPGLVAAASGLALHQASYSGGPVDFVAPMTSYAHGVWGAACVVAALIEREKSGLGQIVSVNALHGMAIVTSQVIAIDPRNAFQPRAYGPGGPNATYTYYPASDGRDVFVATFTPKFQLRLLETLGLEWIIDDPRVAGDYMSMLNAQNRDWIREQLAAAFATASSDSWMQRLREAGVPAGLVATRDEFFDSPQIAAIGMHLETMHPQLGRVEMTGVPIVLTGSAGVPGAPSAGPADRGADVRPWPAQAARAAQATAQDDDSRPRRGPLDGIRVLSMGTFIAGPFSGFLLGELGADVIKLESLEGDPFREQAFHQNRGMRSIAIDLHGREGQELLGEIARDCDLVMENFRPGVAKQLKADYDSLVKHNPQIIALSMTGYGEVGPLADEPAFDALLQAVGGLMKTQGGDDEPVMTTVAINDIVGATLSALAATLALFHRQRTGAGQRIWTSIAGTTMFLQAGEAVRYAARPSAPQGGRDFPGPSDSNRFYAVQDGWIRLHADELDQAALAKVDLIPDSAFGGAKTGSLLAETLVGLSRADAVDKLTSAGVPAVPVRTFYELPDDGCLMAAELLHAHRNEDGSVKFYTAGRYAKFSRTQRTDVTVAPGTGEHTAKILEGIGLSAAEISDLAARGIVHCGESVSWKIPPAYR